MSGAGPEGNSASLTVTNRSPGTPVIPPVINSSLSGSSSPSHDLHRCLRGRCLACDECPAYICLSARVLCDYCGCPPARHQRESGDSALEDLTAQLRVTEPSRCRTSCHPPLVSLRRHRRGERVERAREPPYSCGGSRRMGGNVSRGIRHSTR